MKKIIVLITLVFIFLIVIQPITRYYKQNELFIKAYNLAKKTNKKLMVIGDPCSGNYFEIFSSFVPNMEHGDITIDLYGCENCYNYDINNFEMWSKFRDNSYVIVESGVFSFSTDVERLIKEIKRISGGKFFSAGGTTGILWEHFLYKTYDKNLKNIIYKFDYTKDKVYYFKLLSDHKMHCINF